MTVTAAPPAAVGASPTLVSVVLALAGLEGRKMLTHPVTWLGALGATGMAVFELREQAPVLNRVSVTLAWTMLPLAAATALVAGWAVLRTRGRTDAHPPAIMPLGIGPRVGGVVVGLWFPAVATFAIQLGLLVWVMTRDPVTSMVWTEALAGPVHVLFAGALGAALTRWLPHPSTPLFAVLVLVGLMIAFPYDQSNWGREIGLEWMSPLARPQDIIPYEVAFRPAGLHLGYLAGLGLIAAGIAMLSRHRAVWIVLGLGVIAAATLGPAQLGQIEESRRVETMSRLVGDQADLTCENHDGVVYCAMPGYEGWIDEWAAAAKPILEAAPPDAADGIEIRQYPVHTTFLLDGNDYNNWWWIEPAYQDYISRDVVPVGSIWSNYSSSSVAMDATSKVMGCEPACDGQSQQVAYLWLASHHPEIRLIVEGNVSSDGAPLADCMVAELWSKPEAEQLIRPNWGFLSNSETSYEEAAEILGVSVPIGYDENGRFQNGCP